MDGENEFYEVISNWAPTSSNNLELCKGDVVKVLRKMETGWFLGVHKDKKGWFPSSFVRLHEPSSGKMDSGKGGSDIVRSGLTPAHSAYANDDLLQIAKQVEQTKAEARRLSQELQNIRRDRLSDEILRQDYEMVRLSTEKMERFVELAKPKIQEVQRHEAEINMLQSENQRKRIALESFKEKSKETIRNLQMRYKSSLQEIEDDIHAERRRHDRMLDEFQQERQEMTEILTQLQQENSRHRLEDSRQRNAALESRLDSVMSHAKDFDSRTARLRHEREEGDRLEKEEKSLRDDMYERQLRRREREAEIGKLRSGSVKSGTTGRGKGGKAVVRSQTSADVRRATVTYGTGRPDIDISMPEDDDVQYLRLDLATDHPVGGMNRSASARRSGGSRGQISSSRSVHDFREFSGKSAALRRETVSVLHLDREKDLELERLKLEMDSDPTPLGRGGVGDDRSSRLGKLKARQTAQRQSGLGLSVASKEQTSRHRAHSDVRDETSSSKKLKQVEVVAKHKWDSQAADQLSFEKRDKITVTVMNANGWYFGSCKGREGWFPSTFVHPPSQMLELQGSKDQPPAEQDKKEKTGKKDREKEKSKERAKKVRTIDELFAVMVKHPRKGRVQSPAKAIPKRPGLEVPAGHTHSSSEAESKRLIDQRARWEEFERKDPVNHGAESTIGRLVFSHFRAEELCRAGSVSKSWRVMAREQELWKDLCYRVFSFSLRAPTSAMIDEFTSDWKHNFKVLHSREVTHPLTELAAGGYSGAVTQSGDLYIWGRGPQDADYFLSTDGPTPKRMPFSDARIVYASLSSDSIAAISEAGALYTWGDGRGGRLGHKNATSLSFPKVVDEFNQLGVRVVSASLGNDFAAAVTEKGDIYTWGAKNGSGQAHEFNIPKQLLALGTQRMASVSCGLQHVIAMSVSGEVFTWGENNLGQCGLGDFGAPRRPSSVVGLGHHRVKQVTAGANHCFVLTVKGLLYAWGSDDKGQCGLETDAAVSAPFVTAPGLVGKTINDFLEQISVVSAGSSHSAAVTRSGALFTWGLGSYGQLGHGNVKSSKIPVRVEALESRQVATVSCGEAHTLIVASDGQVLTFGRGSVGQLGHGQNKTVTSPRLVDALTLFTIRHSLATSTSR